MSGLVIGEEVGQVAEAAPAPALVRQARQINCELARLYPDARIELGVHVSHAPPPYRREATADVREFGPHLSGRLRKSLTFTFGEAAEWS